MRLQRVFKVLSHTQLVPLWRTCLGLSRTVYTHCKWPYVWWFPCQNYHVYTVYTYKCMVLANLLHVVICQWFDSHGWLTALMDADHAQSFAMACSDKAPYYQCCKVWCGSFQFIWFKCACVQPLESVACTQRFFSVWYFTGAWAWISPLSTQLVLLWHLLFGFVSLYVRTLWWIGHMCLCGLGRRMCS